MLRIDAISAGYGLSNILHDVSLEVAPGSVSCIVGANGAGKSTTLRVVSGLLAARRGRILVDGRDITNATAREIVQAGVAHVPEGRQIFGKLSVTDNLLLGAYCVRSSCNTRARITEMLEIFPDLEPKLSAYAGSLSGGQQQMLAIARGLMSGPRFLLLDEPSLGLAPLVTATIFAVIGQLAERGVGVLLVEQNGRLALAASQQGYLLEKGLVTMSGTGQELLQNNEIIERYLGVGSHVASDASHGLAARLAASLQV